MRRPPAVAFDVEGAIARTAERVAALRPQLDPAEGVAWLERSLLDALRAGDLVICAKAIEAADKDDDPITDAALRQVGSELQTALLQKRDLAPGHAQIVTYVQRVLRLNRATHRRGRGRQWWDNWGRDLTLCVLIGVACCDFPGLQVTRNRASRRAGARPSVISIVVAALARGGINVEEENLQQHIWLGLLGALARRAMLDRPHELLAVTGPIVVRCPPGSLTELGF